MTTNRKLRLWVSMLAAIVCLTIGATAQASHFRYGNITWRVPDPVGAPRTVQFTVISAWRTAFIDGTSLNFGDGVTNAFTTGATIGTGTDAGGNSFTVTQYTVNHTYATDGPFTAFFTSCCRVSNLSGGQADGTFRVETIVSLASGNTGGPVGQMPSIIQLQNGGTSRRYRAVSSRGTSRRPRQAPRSPSRSSSSPPTAVSSRRAPSTSWSRS